MNQPISCFAVPHPSHEVGVDDIFFSTTDDRGVITDTNEVFDRLARYPREELEGAAHNIVRHPDMPAGIFHTMWEVLRGGEPFVGYMRNRARDNSAYDVLATVTPLPDGGYLSVRIRPGTATFGEVCGIYHEMNDIEHWVMNNDGKKRREAAVDGAARLQEELDSRGLGDYVRFMRTLLPVELAERERGSAIDVEELARRNATARAAVDVYRALDDFMASQETLARTVEAMQAAGARLEEQTAATADVAAEMDRLDIEGPAATLILAPLQVWAKMHGMVEEHIQELDSLLTTLQPVSERSRFYIALARLHALMTSLFAADEADRTGSIDMLVRALLAGLDQMRGLVSEHQRVSRRVAQKAGTVVNLLEVPRKMIGSWIDDTEVHALADGADALVARAAAQIHRSDESIRQLSDLSRVLGEQEALEFGRLQEAVEKLAGLTTR